MWFSILLSNETGTNAWGKIQKYLAEALGRNKSTRAGKQCIPYWESGAKNVKVRKERKSR